jgi:YfiR/HmsC-like
VPTSTTRSSKSAADQCAPLSYVSNQRSCARRHVRAIITMLALLHIPVLEAQQPKVSEYQVKATYLYNFGRFVQWPPNATTAKGDSFSICVLGQDPFGPSLDSTLAGETLDGKPLAAKRISTPRDAGECRILFISSAEENHLKEILAALDESSILTVSDIPAFSRRGGMIQFVLEGGKVRFEINLAKAQTAKLTLSSELLKVATTVRRNTREGGV